MAQGVVVLVAITFEIIPLVSVLLFNGSLELLARILPEGPSSSHWIVQTVMIGISTALVFTLEALKNRS